MPLLFYLLSEKRFVVINDNFRIWMIRPQCRLHD